MNISGLVITTSAEHTETVVQNLKKESLCEYYAHKDGKIVVTIEGNSVQDEIRLMKDLSRMHHVISVEMIYSYCQDELEKERKNLEINERIPEWLNNENAQAEDIIYNGRIRL